MLNTEELSFCIEHSYYYYIYFLYTTQLHFNISGFSASSSSREFGLIIHLFPTLYAMPSS